MRLQDRSLSITTHVGQTDAVRAQHAGLGRDQNFADAQLAGDGAGVLSAGPAESDEYIIGRVVAFRDGNAMDGPRHVGVGNVDKALRQVRRGELATVGGLCDPPAQIVDAVLRRFAIEREGEPLGGQLAQDQIGVGHGERSAATVTGGSRIGARAGRADDKFDAVEIADAAAAGRHGLDREHRRHNANARLLDFEFPLVLACESRDVGAGAPHVKADRPLKASPLSDPGEADHAAGRPREDAVLADEAARINEAAGRRHQLQPARAQPPAQSIDISSQHRVQIRIDDRGVAPRDDLDQWRELAGRADFDESDFSRDAFDEVFMRGIGERMQQADRQRLRAVFFEFREILADVGRIGLAEHGTECVEPLVDFDDARKERLGLLDLQIEEPGAILVGDSQHVGETSRGHEGRPRAAARQQRVRAPRRSELHQHRRQRLVEAQLEHEANGEQGSVFAGGEFIPGARLERLRKWTDQRELP